MSTPTKTRSPSRRPRKVATRCRPSGKRYQSVEAAMVGAPYTLSLDKIPLTLLQWCKAHGVGVEVNRRDAENRSWVMQYVWPGRGAAFYVFLKGVEVVRGSLYSSPTGNGDTVAAAIKDLALQVSSEMVSLPGGRVVEVPSLSLRG